MKIILRHAKLFFLLAIIFVAIGVPTGQPLMALVGVLIIGYMLLQVIKIGLVSTWETYTAPFHFLHRLFTNTLDESPNVTFDDYNRRKVSYTNPFQFVMFGIFGNVAYYSLFLALILFVAGFKPYGDGYAIKQYEYEVGNEVVVKTKNEKFLGTVEAYKIDEKNRVFVTVSDNKHKIKAGVSSFDESLLNGIEFEGIVMGTYYEASNFADAYIKSAAGYANYAWKRIPRFVGSLKENLGLQGQQ